MTSATTRSLPRGRPVRVPAVVAARRPSPDVRPASPGVGLGGLRRLVGNRALSRVLEPAGQASGAGGLPRRAALPGPIGGGGAALDPTLRAAMEALLGHDLGDVRVHRGTAAAASARQMDARAYTVGNHVVLGDGVPPLRSREGRQALGHELVHVVQQRLGGPAAGAGTDTPYERDAEIGGDALADGRKPPRIARGTAVGVARQPMDPKHARGHAGEQGMGFTMYRQEDGWIFFEGPSGSGGHGTTQPGFDGVAYNVKTGEIHILDNKSLKATGNVRSATAIDPSRNLGKNLDGLIERVEAAKDVPGRIRLLGRLKALKASLSSGAPLPDDVKLVVTSVGGRTTDVSPRLKAAGVRHLPEPPPQTPTGQTPTGQTPTGQTPTGQTPTGQTPAPEPVLVPAPKATPTPTPVVEPPVTTTPSPKPPVVEPPVPVVTPPVRPTSAWRAGLKAGGKALIWALVFAGLEYWVHKQLEKDLEESIDKARTGAMPWAQHVKRDDPSKPVYMRVTVSSEEYSRYIPLLGWMPDPPKLHMISMAMVREAIDPPVVVFEDHRLDVWHPGTTTRVTYTEPMIP